MLSFTSASVEYGTAQNTVIVRASGTLWEGSTEDSEITIYVSGRVYPNGTRVVGQEIGIWTSSWTLDGVNFTFEKTFTFNLDTEISYIFNLELLDYDEGDTLSVDVILSPFAYGSLLVDTESKRIGIGLAEDFSTEPNQSLSVKNSIYERGQSLSRKYGEDYIKSFIWPILGGRP